ncbi:MAG TPA: hypothetical protein VGL02_07080, partial [Streptomyces sp.]
MTDTKAQPKPLSPRLAEAVARVPADRIAVVKMLPGTRVVLKGDHPDFDDAEAMADLVRATAGSPHERVFLVRHNGDGTVTVYRDRNHPIGQARRLRMVLPPADEDTTALLNALRAERTEIARKLAHTTLGAAANIIVELFGATSARLLVAKDENLSGDTTIVPLVLFDSDNKLRWFNPLDHRYDARDYPGAEKIQTTFGRPAHDVTDDVVETITTYLEEAYDAVGGCGHALDYEPDDHFGPDVNTLVLDIPAALVPWYMITY